MMEGIKPDAVEWRELFSVDEDKPTPTCNTCRWCYSTADTRWSHNQYIGQCRNYDSYTAWAHVQADDFCKHHEPK